MQFKKNDILLALFILPLAFDFRGEDGGSVVQILLTTVTVAAGVILCIIGKAPRRRGRLWIVMHLAVTIPVWGSLFTFLTNNVPFTHYIRVVLPWFLLAIGFAIGANQTYKKNFKKLEALIEAGCLLSVAFTAFYGFAFTGLSVAEIRYQILSPVLLGCEAIFLHQLLIERRRTVGATLALAGCILLQFVSVTRSSILGLFFIFIATIWMPSGSMLNIVKKAITYARGVGLFLIAGVIASLAFFPESFSRWANRLLVVQQFGVDITSVTRIAELQQQLVMWSESPWSVLFGKGFGTEYGWASEYFDELASVFRISDLIYDKVFYAGHNFWVYSLFSGGILFGLILPISLLFAVYHGMKAVPRLIRSICPGPEVSALSLSTLICVSLIVSTIGGNPLGTRYGGVIYGLALGMMVASYRRLRPFIVAPKARMRGLPSLQKDNAAHLG